VIYQESYEQLLEICKQIALHRQKLAKPRVEEMVCDNINLRTSNERLLAHTIGESLLKRIDRKLLESKNIYVQQFDIPQIKLFYSMSQAVPLVRAGHHAANQYLLAAMRDRRTATLVDIGIGKGVQTLALMDMLAEAGCALEEVRVVGLDPDENNLRESGAAFREKEAELPFAVRYFPVQNLIENFTDRDYNTIREIGGDGILVNSAFSFHHTLHPPGDSEIRTDIFKNFAELHPLMLTLVEPHSNHDTEDLPRRFHNSWQHFGHVFKLIDQSSIDETHKFTIKIKFFGREIRDIFGVSDYFRSERHEPYESWLLRLHRAKFQPVSSDTIKVELPDHFQWDASEGLVRMSYDGVPIVSVMAYSL
jgi:hypothetical protein